MDIREPRQDIGNLRVVLPHGGLCDCQRSGVVGTRTLVITHANDEASEVVELPRKVLVLRTKIPLGNREVALIQELGLDRDQAEEAKILGSIEGYAKDDIDRVLSVTSEQLLDEIQRALSFFWTGSTEEQISSVYLSGGTAQLPDLASAVSTRLQVPVEVCNPFRSLNIGRHVDEDFIEHYASSLAVSVGLATRRQGDK